MAFESVLYLFFSSSFISSFHSSASSKAIMNVQITSIACEIVHCVFVICMEGSTEGLEQKKDDGLTSVAIYF